MPRIRRGAVLCPLYPRMCCETFVESASEPWFRGSGRNSRGAADDGAARGRTRLSGSCALRCRSIWPIGGFASSASRTEYPTLSVFSRTRHERFRQSDALRRVFDNVVAKCIAAGLVGGEGFSIDASLIRADVDKKKRTAGDQPISWPKAEEASRAVRALTTPIISSTTKSASSSMPKARAPAGSLRSPLPGQCWTGSGGSVRSFV
jgi:hypothetical protein